MECTRYEVVCYGKGVVPSGSFEDVIDSVKLCTYSVVRYNKILVNVTSHFGVSYDEVISECPLDVLMLHPA